MQCGAFYCDAARHVATKTVITPSRRGTSNRDAARHVATKNLFIFPQNAPTLWLLPKFLYLL